MTQCARWGALSHPSPWGGGKMAQTRRVVTLLMARPTSVVTNSPCAVASFANLASLVSGRFGSDASYVRMVAMASAVASFSAVYASAPAGVP